MVSQLPRNFQSVDTGHVEIQKYRIGIQQSAQVERVSAIRAHVYIESLKQEQFPDCFPDQIVVVGIDHGKSTLIHGHTVADRRSVKQPRPWGRVKDGPSASLTPDQ